MDDLSVGFAVAGGTSEGSFIVAAGVSNFEGRVVCPPWLICNRSIDVLRPQLA